MAILSAIPAGLYFLAELVFFSTFVHCRVSLRHTLSRRLSHQATLLSPINCLIYLFSKIPSRLYCDVEDFSGINLLFENWRLIRNEALALNESAKIAASDALDDIGLTRFFAPDGGAII